MEIENRTTKLPALKENINSKKELSKFHMFFLYFLIFSFVGWVAETLYSLIGLGYFVKRGFLYGPLCPIYGFGALILIIFFNKYKDHNIKLFIYTAIVFSAFEYVVGFGMDALFATKWWDYTNDFLNINGRISIFYTFMWGVAALLVINFVYPFFQKIINTTLNKIPYKVQLHGLNILFSIYLTDTVLSFAKNLM